MHDNSVTVANATTAVTKLQTTGTVATTLADGTVKDKSRLSFTIQMVVLQR